MDNNIWDFFALIWLLIGDVTAIFALVGASLTLLIATIDAFRGRSPVRAFKKTSEWSIGALCLALVLFASVMISDQVPQPSTLILGFSRFSIAFMLSLALAFMASSIVFSHLIRR